MTSQNSKILKYTVEKAEKEKNTFKRILFRCQMVIESPDPPPGPDPGRELVRATAGRMMAISMEPTDAPMPACSSAVNSLEDE